MPILSKVTAVLRRPFPVTSATFPPRALSCWRTSLTMTEDESLI